MSLDLRVSVEIKREKEDQFEDNIEIEKVFVKEEIIQEMDFQPVKSEDHDEENDFQVHVKKETIDNVYEGDDCKEVDDKVERVPNVSEQSESTALEGLYNEHLVKGDVVVGPKVLQRDLPAVSHASNDAVSAPGRSARIQSAAGAKDGLFFCQICFKPFPNKHYLQKHTRIHTGDKPYSCEVCHKQFVYKHHLSAHTLTHTGEKRFSCDICNKQFAQKIGLTKHYRMHTGEKPFSCPICQKQFSDKSHLNAHRRIHTGEKPFSCEICQKKFAYKINLNSHLFTHTGEKPFSCEICHKKFAQRSDRNKHIRIHTGEKPFSCEICQKQFTQKSQLVTHKRVHAGETVAVSIESLSPPP